jgi:CRISPR-associated protein Csx3
LPFHGGGALAPLSEHMARALAVVRGRTIAGTRLAAYGHGDWNDALQPADPAMRDHLCSAWTVTLHHRMLQGLAAAWRRLGRDADADQALADAQAVADDFQRLLIADGVLAGYAAFDQPGAPQLLLHPRDGRTGIHHSALAMVHAIADELFTPAQAEAHAALIERELLGPDGLRLFDRPLRYAGGTMTLFQRGESASYFGREIGLMYMHAHLRWAEALARLGRGDALLQALRLANPIGLQALVPQAASRQRNCYYSSSDAAFADREAASAQYGRIADGTVALEGGWRIYSSGAGIAYRLVVQRLLGLVQQQDRLRLDPVLPPALDGLDVQLPLYGHAVRVVYRVGPHGHGPTAVQLDGQPLVLAADHNRYRAPGVWTDAAAVRERLAQGGRTLTITLG